MYTHAVGNARQDKRLGQQRGLSIKSLLKAEGLDPAKIKIISYGSSKNKASNFTKRGRQKNQKVRFSIKVKKSL